MLARLRSFLSALARRRRLEREMEAEWQSHIDARAEALMASGLSAQSAIRRARSEFGDPLRWREQAREARGLGVLHDVRGDAGYALRQLRRSPIVSVVAIATLALGIGANTAIFSVVNSVLLRPLPVKNPHELVLISVPDARRNLTYVWNYPFWEQIRSATEVFGGTLAYLPSRFDLAPGGQTDFVDGLWATGSFFEVLGVSAYLGRTFSAADDQKGGGAEGPVAVISHALWQRRFAGSVDAIGRTIDIDRTRYTIVGVLPPGFFGPVAGRLTDIVIPAGLSELASPTSVGANWLTIMARLKPGQTLVEATTALRSVQPQIYSAVRALSTRETAFDQRLKQPLALLPAPSGNRLVTLGYERPLFLMLAVVGLVLLIACANIGNLLLARAAARRHELSVRAALGGSRWRLARQMFVESLVLAAFGAAGGVWLAVTSGPALVRVLAMRANALVVDFSPDRRVLAFTAVISVVAACVFGALPALRASRVDPMHALKERSGALGTRGRLTGSWVVAQVALSLVLVCAAGLFARSLVNLARRDLGFDTRGVSVVDLNVPRPELLAKGASIRFDELRRAVAALPGVTAASIAFDIPVGGGVAATSVDIVGKPPLPPGENDAYVNAVAPGWFAVYKTPIVAGRDFSEADAGRPLAIANRAFTRKFLSGDDPIGRVVRQTDLPPGESQREWEIIGVAADAVQESVREAVPPMLYFQLSQLAGVGQLWSAFLAVRSDEAMSATLRPAIVRAVTSVDKNLSLTFLSMSDVVDGSIAIDRALALLMAFFGALAALLAGLGLYGVTADAVNQRLGEMAIRMALGADRAGVIRLILSRVVQLVGVGIVVGVAATLWLSQFAAPLLYDLAPWDPITLVLSALVLAAVGGFAGWLPAYRGSRIEPAAVLKQLG